METVTAEVSIEPQVVFATIRESVDKDSFTVLDIECRFSDGQKFAAVQVDAEFPYLAERIAEFLNSGSVSHVSE